jgi:pimeloyl-ACP methyl ester carboxylesterase
MQRLTSKDGTAIAYQRAGAGSPIVIIGGALVDHRFYAPLAEELAKDFTVYNFDRRGRGHSADTEPYAVQREIEDVAALVAHAGEPVVVYGHSAGSALALRAAHAGVDIAKLIIADPPYTPHGDDDVAARAAFAEEAAQVQALHDKGDVKGAAAFFLGGVGLSPQEAEEFLQSPAGEGMVDCARALPYDYAMLGDGVVPDELAATVRVPSLVLAVEAMPETSEALAEALPNARLEPIPGPTRELSPLDIAAAIAPFAKQR